jgi:site-specific DNA recombinase
VLAGLETRLFDPDYVEAYVEEYRRTFDARRSGERKLRARLERRQADAGRRIARLVAALGDDRLGAIAEVADALVEAKAELRSVASELAELEAESKVVDLHPGLAAAYRRNVADLIAGLKSEDSEASREAVRALVERIVVTPARGRGVELEVRGILSTVLSVAAGEDVNVLYRACPRGDSAETVHWLRAIA